MRDMILGLMDPMDKMSAVIAERDAEIERLRVALTFYATGEWADGYPGGGSGMMIDTGETARAALNTQR